MPRRQSRYDLQEPHPYTIRQMDEDPRFRHDAQGGTLLNRRGPTRMLRVMAAFCFVCGSTGRGGGGAIMASRVSRRYGNGPSIKSASKALITLLVVQAAIAAKFNGDR